MNIAGFRISVAAFVALALAAPAWAQKKYDPGATDREIKIGNIAPYTGPFSDYGATGRAQAAYFQMINDRGGVNGRRIDFVSLDNGTDVLTAVDLARKLVEQDKVLLIVGTWGTSQNLAIRGYLNKRRVPQLFVGSAVEAFNDPGHFPWTMGFQATFRTEGMAYGRYILQTKPDAKIAVLYASDDVGNEYRAGLRAGLGDKASAMIVKELPFKYSDHATLDPQIVALKASGADVFVNLSFGKFATQAIRTAYDIGWHPLQFLPNGSLSIAAFLEPAGTEKATGIVSNARSKGWSGADALRDPAVREFLEWIKTYTPKGSARDANYIFGYEVAQTLIEVLRKCGDDLTRANVMKQAASLDLELGMLRPGIKITTSPTDYRPIKELYLVKFDGKAWVPIGGVTGR